MCVCMHVCVWPFQHTRTLILHTYAHTYLTPVLLCPVCLQQQRRQQQQYSPSSCREGMLGNRTLEFPWNGSSPPLPQTCPPSSLSSTRFPFFPLVLSVIRDTVCAMCLAIHTPRTVFIHPQQASCLF